MIIILLDGEVIINHVDEEPAAKQALTGEDVVDLLVFLADDPLVFFLKLCDQRLVDLASPTLVAFDISNVDELIGHAPQGARYLVKI